MSCSLVLVVAKSRKSFCFCGVRTQMVGHLKTHGLFEELVRFWSEMPTGN